MEHAALALMLLPTLGGCGGGGAIGDGEAAESDTPSYLLMDSAIRSEGGEVEVGRSRVSTRAALPVSLSPEERVMLRTGVGLNGLEPRRGQLAWIHGPDGFVEWLSIPGDTNPDALLVDGEETAVSQLAEMLSAEVAEREVGTWELRAPGLWERTSFLEPPEGIIEAHPLLLSSADAAKETGAPIDTWGRLPPRKDAPAGLVGVYSSEETSLILDAAGGFVLNRWRVGESGCEASQSIEGVYEYRAGMLELNPRGSGQYRTKWIVSGAELKSENGALVMSPLMEGVSE